MDEDAEKVGAKSNTGRNKQENDKEIKNLYDEDGYFDDSDFSNQNEITCPYCGYRYHDSWEQPDEELNDGEECPNCYRKFRYSRSVETTYSSERDCELNGVDHDWSPERVMNDKDGSNTMFRICRICGKHDIVRIIKPDD